jgi:hypothetical protein
VQADGPFVYRQGMLARTLDLFSLTVPLHRGKYGPLVMTPMNAVARS